MRLPTSRRRFLSAGMHSALVAAGGRFFVVDSVAQERTEYRPLLGPLDRFVEQYLREMNAPGMTLVLADRDGIQRVATYGFSDLEGRLPVGAEQLFQIGSISKSFIAVALLGLVDERRLDLQKPIAEYLPWFRVQSDFAPITTHHLLTHSSGLPANAPVFLSDPAQAHRAAYAPGKYFHYSNLGYTLLGYLLWALDGRPMPTALRARVLAPLGMNQSEPVITLDIRERLAKSYAAFKNDRPYPRHGRLSEAPGVVVTSGSGCVASTPRDMGRYIQMIANRGRGPNARLMSESSFQLFARPHLKADQFGPTIAYGYGIAVDTLDGHTILRHTGGMLSFASSMVVDIDEGVGVFVSINAAHGYRPNPVAEYAIRLLRAGRARRSLPPPPASYPATRITNAADYAGTYRSSDGRALEFVARGDQLLMVYRGRQVPLEAGTGAPDGFVVPHPDFERFVLVFGRADAKDPKSAVVEAGWGGDWFAHSRYSGPSTFDYPKDWDQYVGHYRNESPWVGSHHIVVRKGRLMLDGVVSLAADAGGLFRVRDPEHSPEWVRFGEVVNGVAMRLRLSGEDLGRVMTA